MNNVIDSITDYKPEDTFLLPEQFAVIKGQIEGAPFEIEDEKLAGQLIDYTMEREEEHKNKTPEGAFILTIFDNSGIICLVGVHRQSVEFYPIL